MTNSFVCEGVLQPNPLPYSSGPQVRFLPAPLIKARAEVLNPLNCQDIGRTARQALFGILAFFDIKKPNEPVFASREKICAEALLGSQPTLYRALADLVSHGYIRRQQSRRLGQRTYGQYSVSRIWLEEKALKLLGLLEDIASTEKQSKQQNQAKSEELKKPRTRHTYQQGPSLTMRDRLQELELPPNQQLSTKEQPHENQRSVSHQNRAGESFENSIDTKTGLPTELLRLKKLGLSKARICALMKQARFSGNQGKLGKVVKLVWERLTQLGKPQAVFAYLAKLVQQRKDYTRLVELESQYEDKSRMPDVVAHRLQLKLPVFLERSEGMVLVTRAGKLLGPIQKSEGGGFVDVRDEAGTRRTIPVNLKLIEAWEEGAVILRPAGFHTDSNKNDWDD